MYRHTRECFLFLPLFVPLLPISLHLSEWLDNRPRRFRRTIVERCARPAPEAGASRTEFRPTIRTVFHSARGRDDAPSSSSSYRHHRRHRVILRERRWPLAGALPRRRYLCGYRFAAGRPHARHTSELLIYARTLRKYKLH